MPIDWFLDVIAHTDVVLFAAFGLVVGIQLIYYWAIFSRLAFYKAPDAAGVQPPVSVVICARNEYANLEKNLPIILNQDYPDYEVVVVNDGSDDESDLLLHELKLAHKRLKIINLQKDLNFFTGKKFPLAVGIRCAKHPIVVLTDADCIPEGPNWLSQIASSFDSKAELVLGYGPLRKMPGFLNKIIRYDTFFVALQYLSFALIRKPYMGVGRNLAYKRDLFFRNKGFTSHYGIPTGDDDLFVNQAATSKNTRVCIHQESWTTSDPKETTGEWFRQKKRHMVAGKYYNGRSKFFLGLFGISQLAFYILFALTMIFTDLSTLGLYVLILFGLRTISLLIIFFRAGKKLGQSRLSLFSPLFDLLLLVCSIIFAMASLFSNKSKWK